MLPRINFLGVVLFLFASCQRSNVDSPTYTSSHTADSIINAAHEVRLNGQENLYI